tara:strand:+ start:628 stop:1476 length:849 start_codon:yes stop_codon:yes gene_type:complete
MKACSKCGSLKHLFLFYKDTRCKGGFKADCKVCCGIRQKKYANKNKEKINTYAKVYREENRELINENCRAYYKTHKVEMNAQNKKYCMENKESLRKHRALQYKENRGRLLAQAKLYGEENKEARAIYAKKYNKENREFLAKKDKHRYDKKKAKYVDTYFEEHGNYPPNRLGSDNDTLYVWEVVDELWADLPIFKIGITSERLGKTRIHQVARSYGFEYKVHLLIKVHNESATSLECRIHGMLDVIPKLIGDGATEFRACSYEQMEDVIKMITFDEELLKGEE